MPPPFGVLQSRLLLLKKEQEDAQKEGICRRREGNVGRTDALLYVLNPYQMVKDLRTEHEVGNTQAVLDGEIDDSIDAGIRWRAGEHRPSK